MKEIAKIQRISSHFDVALRGWLDGLSATLRTWGEKTVIRARSDLLSLHDRHGIPPQVLLAQLAIQKRVALMKDHQRRHGIADDVAGLKKSIVKGSRLHKVIDAARKDPMAAEYLGISASLLRASEMLLSNPQPRRGAPKNTELRAMLLPLVEIFMERTGKPRWEIAAALVSAAFPKIKFCDPRKSAYGALKPTGRPIYFLHGGYPPNDNKLPEDLRVPPLNKIESNPARRAAVQILTDRAREDLYEIRTIELTNTLKARPKQVKLVKIPREQNPICRAIHCADKKSAYAKAVTRQNRLWRQSDEKGGWFFLCGMCGQVRHNLCDGHVEAGNRDTCGRCAPKKSNA